MKALHTGGEQEWRTLVEQTASMWLDYAGVPPAHVAGIDRPALVLAADRDELIPLDLNIALYRTLTHAELAVVPAADHTSPSDPRRADAFAAAIADFARRQTDT